MPEGFLGESVLAQEAVLWVVWGTSRTDKQPEVHLLKRSSNRADGSWVWAASGITTRELLLCGIAEVWANAGATSNNPVAIKAAESF